MLQHFIHELQQDHYISGSFRVAPSGDEEGSGMQWNSEGNRVIGKGEGGGGGQRTWKIVT